MQHTRTGVIASILLLLTACAEPVADKDYAGQFTTRWHASDRFTVSYRANPASSEAVISDLSLLLSAETALEHGFPYFVLVSDETWARLGRDRATARVDGLIPAPPAASNRVVGFRARPAHFHYVALFVKASLRGRYDLEQAPAAI